MRFGLILTAVLSLIASSGVASAAPVHGKARKIRKLYVEGEILVKQPAGTMDSEMPGLISKLDSHLKVALTRNLGGGFHHVKFSDTAQTLTTMLAAAKAAGFEAQPNFMYYATQVPNDPDFPQMWGLSNSGQTIQASASYADTPLVADNPGVAGKDIGIETAWDYVTDCSAVTVAVIDTGINYLNSDLAANMWNGGSAFPNHGYDFIGNTNDPMDLNGHGTHVSATIGAVGNNRIGTTGICWKASLMAVRVLDATGAGTTSAIVSGINFAVAHGAKIMNMSLAASNNDPAFQSALVSAEAANVLAVVAAGNDMANVDSGTTPSYPCSYDLPNIVCVAALTQAYNLASFSNYGATSVHVGAPGVNVLSAWNGIDTTFNETFNTNGVLNWTVFNAATASSWGFQALLFTENGAPVQLDTLSAPVNWDGQTVTYLNGSDTRAYKNYNFSAYRAVTATVDYFIDTAANRDFFNIAFNPAGGEPFSQGTSTSVLKDSGTSMGSNVQQSLDLSACNTATCTLGMQFTSTANSMVSFGVDIVQLSITELALDPGQINVISGTSMATPHVTGLAALIWAFNPSYTLADVVQSIKNGGVPTAALTGKTVTGNAISAIGSISYIGTPAGVTAKAL